jgi:hypothetical protein
MDSQSSLKHSYSNHSIKKSYVDYIDRYLTQLPNNQ